VTLQDQLDQMAAWFTGFRSRDKALAGDRTSLLERLRDPGVELIQPERDLLAAIGEGKVKRPRGPRRDDDLRAKKMQAAGFFILLTEAIGLLHKEAEGRLADFYGVADTTVHDWIGDEKKRIGLAAWQAKIASAPADFALDRPMYMENERLAELLKSAE
jgi:hypothetical protein